MAEGVPVAPQSSFFSAAMQNVTDAVKSNPAAAIMTAAAGLAAAAVGAGIYYKSSAPASSSPILSSQQLEREAKKVSEEEARLAQATKATTQTVQHLVNRGTLQDAKRARLESDRLANQAAKVNEDVLKLQRDVKRSMSASAPLAATAARPKPDPRYFGKHSPVAPSPSRKKTLYGSTTRGKAKSTGGMSRYRSSAKGRPLSSISLRKPNSPYAKRSTSKSMPQKTKRNVKKYK